MESDAASGGISGVAAVTWSPVRGWPSFHLVPIEPASVLSRLSAPGGDEASGASAMVFTSATLSDTGERESLLHQARRYGLFDTDAFVHLSSYEPEKFGNARFAIAAKDSPQPTEKRVRDGRQMVTTSAAWLDHVARKIRDAVNEGGRALVLTVSHADTEALALRLMGQEAVCVPLLAHLPGTSLRSLVTRFSQSEESVLISASAWEGLDLPGLVNHLFITRLPYAPPDTPEDRVLYRHLTKSRGYSEKKAASILFSRKAHKARRKFRQGFGRGIRHVDDAVKVWITDPRFAGSGFVQAIPARFRQARGISGRSVLDAAEAV